MRRGWITKQSSCLVRWAAIESVMSLPDTSHIGAIREQVAHRRENRNIGAVAAARRQLELVFYGESIAAIANQLGTSSFTVHTIAAQQQIRLQRIDRGDRP